jgi:hypothetical protein
MKKNVVVCFFMQVSFNVYSQSSMVTLSGGYAFSKIEDTDTKVTGYRINGLYEFLQTGDKLAHGLEIGYINLSATEEILNVNYTYTVNSVPIYYAPKFLFGKEKFKGFVKGAIGGQFANLKVEGNNSANTNDFGLYAGIGAGLMIYINEKLFINGEYEIAWASNSLYKDHWINSAMGGIGIKF